MRHAILGAGGIGGFIGVLLSAGGEEVTSIVRPGVEATEPRQYELERPSTAPVSAPVTVATALGADDPVDVLWITTKATQLDAALASVRAARPRAVVPLLNGLHHLAVLRGVFGADAVVPATIAVGAEKVAPGRFRQLSVFAAMVIAERGRPMLAESAAIFERSGLAVVFQSDEETLMWKKLVGLSVFALVTSAGLKSIGPLRDDPAWRTRIDATISEVTAVAVADGAAVTEADSRTLVFGAPEHLKSSMLRDVEAGREPELDAIAGSILELADAHGIAVPTVRALAAEVHTNWRAEVARRGVAV